MEESKLLECVTSLSNQMGPLDNSVRLEIDSEKSPNSHIRLDTILAFLTGIGKVSLVKVSTNGTITGTNCCTGVR